MSLGDTLDMIEIDAENKKLKQQLADANAVIELLNNKATGREYGLDAEDIWEISKPYLDKYGDKNE